MKAFLCGAKDRLTPKPDRQSDRLFSLVGIHFICEWLAFAPTDCSSEAFFFPLPLTRRLWSHWRWSPLPDLPLQTPEEGAAFVCFGGPKGELPKGKDGSYGTSLTLAKAMDASSDVLIAYKQNHRWLTPDHGFPVRIVIPGFIGGRMVRGSLSA